MPIIKEGFLNLFKPIVSAVSINLDVANQAFNCKPETIHDQLQSPPMQHKRYLKFFI